MTDDELKALVASLAVSNKELRDSQKETGTQIKELSVSQKETDAILKENAIEQKEVTRELDEAAMILGIIDTNQGDVAEDFFYNSLIKDNHLGSLAFDDVTKNMSKHRGQLQEEYDIFLTNGNAIAIIEVKYKAHLGDIEKLERKFTNFKTLFPMYKDYKLYGAMASFCFNKETKSELLNQGFFVLERNGDLVNTENSDYLKVA